MFSRLDWYYTGCWIYGTHTQTLSMLLLIVMLVVRKVLAIACDRWQLGNSLTSIIALFGDRLELSGHSLEPAFFSGLGSYCAQFSGPLASISSWYSSSFQSRPTCWGRRLWDPWDAKFRAGLHLRPSCPRPPSSPWPPPCSPSSPSLSLRILSAQSCKV